MTLHRTTKARSATIRKIGWLAVASMLATALLAPAAGPVFAVDGNQTNVSSENYTELCTGGPGGSDITPGEGEVAWLFVHAGVDSSLSGTLTANYAGAGAVGAASYAQGGIKYLIVTSAPESLNSFSDDIEGGVLTLSHVCHGAQASQPEESQPEESQPEESQPEESVGGETDTPSASLPEETVQGETDTPAASDPETDTLTGTAAPSDSWRMVLIALAALMASVLVMTPAKVADRRR